ncbi:MAG: histidinol-phosphate aminotransferase family protein [Pseudomonadaceae bacterium]|nr:histidinol-phosphate aminotransferase family protein [Pseudomonadaceae bacterium]
MTTQTPQIIHDRNELLQGPAPKCIETLRNFPIEKVFSYPDGYYGSVLVPELAKRYGVAPQQVIISYGAENLLETVFKWLRDDDCVLTQQHHYRFYTFALKHLGIPLHTFAMREEGHDFVFDVDDCIAQYKKHKPRLLLLTSPNNPTGNVLALEDFKRILAAVEPHTLVIMDEAYWGFDHTYNEQIMLDLLHQTPNLVLARTFSKYYGLAGLRMGYALCGTNVVNMLKYQPPFLGFCRVAEAVALAALGEGDYYAGTAQQVIDERGRMVEALKGLAHVHPYNSRANMILVKLTPEADAAMTEALPTFPVVTIRKDHGLYWRISVGTKDVNDAIVAFLKTLG